MPANCLFQKNKSQTHDLKVKHKDICLLKPFPNLLIESFSNKTIPKHEIHILEKKSLSLMVIKYQKQLCCQTPFWNDIKGKLKGKRESEANGSQDILKQKPWVDKLIFEWTVWWVIKERFLFWKLFKKHIISTFTNFPFKKKQKQKTVFVYKTISVFCLNNRWPLKAMMVAHLCEQNLYHQHDNCAALRAPGLLSFLVLCERLFWVKTKRKKIKSTS